MTRYHPTYWCKNTFRMTDVVEEIRLESRKMQYLYESDGQLYFMDVDSYEQIFISEELLGEQKKFLKDGDFCTILFHESLPLTAEVANFINFKVTEAEPGIKGDSATNILKYAVIESGARIQVPLFIKEGDIIRIDTRTGKYIERISTK